MIISLHLIKIFNKKTFYKKTLINSMYFPRSSPPPAPDLHSPVCICHTGECRSSAGGGWVGGERDTGADCRDPVHLNKNDVQNKNVEFIY